MSKFILKMFLLFFLVYGVSGMHMEASDKALLESHPVTFTHVDFNALETLVRQEYEEMQKQCNLPPANIAVKYDSELIDTSVLAWASQNLNLQNRIWVPSLFATSEKIHFTLGFNPEPPNGWHVGDCSAIRWKYDLRTVIRHEILHGIGLGSSIQYTNQWSVGIHTGGFCFPRLYDVHITDQSNQPILNGCNMVDITNKKLYVGDVELYHPSEFTSGSSLSHHNYPGYLFYYKSMPNTCMHISKYEASMLRPLGIECSVSAATTLEPTLSNLLILGILFLLLECECF